MKLNKGAVLTGVILMVLVMTLIGVPLLGMVVYNYRVVEMSNSIKRSEYENEMAMDIISRIIRETVINAISHAKEEATTGVNELAELQRTKYSSLQGQYTDKWINEYNAWKYDSEYEYNDEILGSFVDKINAGNNEASVKDSELEEYVSTKVMNELDYISGPSSEEISKEVGVLLNDEGIVDQDELNKAYNKIFSSRYKAYIIDELRFVDENERGKILVKSEYESIIADNIDVSGMSIEEYESIIADNIDVSGMSIDDLLEDEESILYKDYYLKIDKPYIDDRGNPLKIDVSTRFKKNNVTPPTTLSATFVIKTPAFDSVASVTQESIPLSNALLNQGGVIVGGQLILDKNTTMQIASDLTVLGKNSDDTAVLLNPSSKLEAKNPGGSISSSRISVAKDIVLDANELVGDGKTTLSTGLNPIYYRNLYVGNSSSTGEININFNGDAVAKDDLEINHEGIVNIYQETSHNYYGFNDTNDNGPDSSSSIVINSTNLNNKDITLGNLYLAGRAFIDGVRGTKNIRVKDDHGNDLTDGDGNIIYADTTYKTGESIAIKGNYIAYQTLISDYNSDYGFLLDDSKNYIFAPSKLKLSEYFMETKGATDKKNAQIWLFDDFTTKPDNFKGSFDVNYKWKYFMNYAWKHSDILKKVNIKNSEGKNSAVRYIEGTGFDKNGKVIGSSNESMSDASFRNNLEYEYEKYTKYFGYMPMNGGAVDNSKAKTEIFGNNGWVKASSSPQTIKDNYYQYYTTADNTTFLTLGGNDNHGIIVCKGNLTLKVPTTATFKGVIIVGGNLTIDGGTLILADGKEEVINTVIGNYLGTNTDTTGEPDKLYESFTYDGSGSSYIVTNIGNELVNINDLIGITNWKKSNYGRL